MFLIRTIIFSFSHPLGFFSQILIQPDSARGCRGFGLCFSQPPSPCAFVSEPPGGLEVGGSGPHTLQFGPISQRCQSKITAQPGTSLSPVTSGGTEPSLTSSKQSRSCQALFNHRDILPIPDSPPLQARSSAAPVGLVGRLSGTTRPGSGTSSSPQKETRTCQQSPATFLSSKPWSFT